MLQYISPKEIPGGKVDEPGTPREEGALRSLAGSGWPDDAQVHDAAEIECIGDTSRSRPDDWRCLQESGRKGSAFAFGSPTNSGSCCLWGGSDKFLVFPLDGGGAARRTIIR